MLYDHVKMIFVVYSTLNLHTRLAMLENMPDHGISRTFGSFLPNAASRSGHAKQVKSCKSCFNSQTHRKITLNTKKTTLNET